jgi:hypothetical protein
MERVIDMDDLREFRSFSADKNAGGTHETRASGP